jgi:hypothetical protein
LKTWKEKVIVGTDSIMQDLFEFPHENARLKAIHAQGESQQFKIGLPFAFAKLSQQNSFEII